MDKLCAIDIGTNSIRILIAKIEKGRIAEGFKDLETTRIGENVDKTGELSYAAIERSIKALKGFVDMAKKEGIKKIPIIATSAVRDAKNRKNFLNRVKEELDMEVEVISGQREAALGFSGVLMGLKKDNENILVIDIGGGSTEFIFGNSAGIGHLISLDMGAVRMTEKFIKADPIDPWECDELINEIDRIMRSTINEVNKYSIDRIIAIGGTATTIASMSKKLAVYDREQIHNIDISHNEIKDLLNELISKDLNQRKNMVGLQSKRADIITAGVIILDRILTLVNGRGVRISEYDNLEGLIFEQLNHQV